MNKNIFHSFLKNKYFKHTVEYIKAIQVQLYGRNNITYENPILKNVVFISANPKSLEQMGFGKILDKQNYFMFCNFEIGMNDLIQYEGERYQRLNSNNFKEYGFNKYIVSIYNENNLNQEYLNDNI
jgi:hypothetical protein